MNLSRIDLRLEHDARPSNRSGSQDLQSKVGGNRIGKIAPASPLPGGSLVYFYFISLFISRVNGPGVETTIQTIGSRLGREEFSIGEPHGIDQPWEGWNHPSCGDWLRRYDQLAW